MDGSEKILHVMALSLSGAPLDNIDSYKFYLQEQINSAPAQTKLALLPAHSALLLFWKSGLLGNTASLEEALQEYRRRDRELNSLFLQIHSRLALEFDCYLLPGTLVEEEGGKLYQSALLLDPCGETLGKQRQTHLSREEKKQGFSRDVELSVYQTSLGKLGIVVGTDSRYPEVSRILALQGAELICHPGALLTSPYNPWQQAAGMWREVQQNQFFCLESQLCQKIGEKEFCGLSAVHAPCEITPGSSGYLAQGEKGQKAVSADLDFEARERWIQKYPLLSLLNPAAYRDYLPRLYPPEPPETQEEGKKHILPPYHAEGNNRFSSAPRTFTRIRAAAAQVELKPCRDPLEYAADMRRHVEKAASRDASLVVFPENNGLALLGMLPGIKELQEKSPSADSKNSLIDVPVSDIVRSAAPLVEKISLQTFSRLAVAYGLYIMAGSFMVQNRAGQVVNRAYLYGPEGSLLGTQDKVHLFPTELKWGISPARQFQVFPSPIGTLSMPICMDATYFESFRILGLQGAEINMIPIADPGPYNPSLALRGAWARAQELPTYAIRSALVGSFAGFEFSGRAGIFAPLELSPGGDGILAETPEPDGNDMAVAELDLEALRELRSAHPYLGDTNPELYRRYQPFLYRSLSGGSDDSLY